MSNAGVRIGEAIMVGGFFATLVIAFVLGYLIVHWGE